MILHFPSSGRLAVNGTLIVVHNIYFPLISDKKAPGVYLGEIAHMASTDIAPLSKLQCRSGNATDSSKLLL